MTVSYERKQRQTAATAGKGLITLAFTSPGKTPGKFGDTLTVQGPATEYECAEVLKLIGKLAGQRMRARVKRAGIEKAKATRKRNAKLKKTQKSK